MRLEVILDIVFFVLMLFTIIWSIYTAAAVFG